MNLRCTTLTVDRCTPRDRFARVAQISFPTSIRTSIDDSCLDSPLSPFYSPTGESFARPRASSEAFRGPHSPIHNTRFACLFPDYRYDHPDPPRSPTPIDSFHPPSPPMHALKALVYTSHEPPSPALTSDLSSPTVADPVPVTPGFEPSHPIWIFDSSLREVDFDVTCLNALDEQLLHAPKDCFLDICWAEAVYDEDEDEELHPELMEKPWVRQSQPERATDSEQMRPDPIMMRVERKPSFLPSPESYAAQTPQRVMFAASESRMLYQNANHSVHFFPVPQQRDSRRKYMAEDPPDIRSGKLKLFSDAYDTLTGRRRTTSN
ncbi:uncharacterized protein EDB91DRAFT_1249511 [Suillus paluster]|uniref:uncharacterized protein n=1 Tax=Suillus paluster TaxID=48578 RepID=UPI001B87EA8A|nr:uncharacterized protein EDB91DRAFT_1249511 [Suillus paluster]KAG1737836.1 hypothetical protein EDB91DRAFT_1249511 [Suillus paluster]